MGINGTCQDNKNSNNPDNAPYLNKRDFIRYHVREFRIAGIGSVQNISMSGLLLSKDNKDIIEDGRLSIPLEHNSVEAEISWQNDDYAALRFIKQYDASQLIKALSKRIREPVPDPDWVVTNEEIMSVTQKDVLGSCLNLIEELENPDTDVSKLQTFVEEISDICGDPAGDEESEDMQDIISDEESHSPRDLKETIIDRAVDAYGDQTVEIQDVNFAIARLGLESVKKISSEYLKEKMTHIEVPLSEFSNYQAFNIFKTVIFKEFAHFFGFEDEDGDGSLMLALDTKGIDVLMSLKDSDAGRLKAYYHSSPRLYSEISRVIERNICGRDLLLINKYYFEKKMDMFQEIYDGYVLGHLMLNPCYKFDNEIKLDVTRKKLFFAFLVYLSVLATEFIMDGDRTSCGVLIKILKRSGMSESRITSFLGRGIEEAVRVLKDLGLSGKMRNRNLRRTTFSIQKFLGKDIHFTYLIDSFKKFSSLKGIRRMALMYEDTAYAHFILTKLLSADDIGMGSRAYCVVPCRNISEQVLYLEDYAFFDLIILKDIDRLPRSHMKEFIRLWKSFKGKVIATFNRYSFLDIDQRELYELLKEHIVNFPSYFAERSVHERMVDHTAQYIKPFIAERDIDKDRYQDETFSMSYIKDRELRNFE